jgi:hypothetical protein
MIHKPVAVATASTLLKFSTLPAFLVIARSVSHISLSTASTLQVLNTSSIRFLSFFCFPHLLNYLQRQHFKFSTLPAFLVILLFPTSPYLQRQHFKFSTLPTLLLFLTSPYPQRQHFKFSTLLAFLVSFCFSHLLTYSVNTSQHFQHFLSSLLPFLTSPYLRFFNRA